MVAPSHKRSDAVFRAIADPTRRRILALLRGRKYTVGELAGHFRTSRPAISKHLRVLRNAKLVSEERAGRMRLYQIQPAPLRSVVGWIEGYSTMWRVNLDNLKHHLEGK